MESTTASFAQLSAAARRVALRLATVGENRVELLAVEMQEGREHLLHALLLAVGVATFGLLAALTFTATIVVLLWAWSPPAVLFTLTVVYGASGFYLYRRLTGLMRKWQTLPATLDQIRKDRACLEKLLA
jgi:uncharacterized membrane protein YqjE